MTPSVAQIDGEPALEAQRADAEQRKGELEVKGEPARIVFKIPPENLVRADVGAYGEEYGDSGMSGDGEDDCKGGNGVGQRPPRASVQRAPRLAASARHEWRGRGICRGRRSAASRGIGS